MAKYSTDFYSRDAVLVAQDLLGKVIVVTDHGGCNFKWRIIETEAYKEEENNNGQTICHTNERLKSCGKIFAELSNGLIITCGDSNKCDNVLIRGVMTVYYSQPYKAMKSVTAGFDMDLSAPIDLTTSNRIWIEQSRINTKPIEDIRVGLENKSKNRWNFKLFDLKNETKSIDADLLKNLNE